MVEIPITNFTMHGGSRHFLSFPESILSKRLADAIRNFPEFTVTEFLETIPESWIDFDFAGYKFTINNQFGEYWFFANNPDCPESILIELRDQFATILPPH